MIETKYRDATVKISSWNGNQTPNILFIETERFKKFEKAELLLREFEINKEKSERQLNVGNENIMKEEISRQKNFKSSETKLNFTQEFSENKKIVFPHSLKELHNFADEINKENENFFIVQSEESIKTAKESKAEIFIIANSEKLLSNTKEFVKTIVNLRENIGFSKLIYLPIALPHEYAVFVYCTIDLFSSLPLIMQSREGYFLTNEQRIYKNDLREIPCNCEVCSKIETKEEIKIHKDILIDNSHSFSEKEFNFEKLLLHNYNIAINEIKTIRNSIRNRNFRELVEKRIRNSPHLVEILRHLDLRHYEFQEKLFPINKSQLLCTSSESLFRADILRFQKRLRERYTSPKFAKILLLLPCSAKKPYSFSKTHSFFREVLANVKNPNVVHEVIITSPLGIVPRELELFYPAQNYDIAVSGDWDEKEIKLIQEQFLFLVKNNKYEYIVCHLDEETEFILEAMNKIKFIKIENVENYSEEFLNELENYREIFIKTTIDKTTSDASLNNLKNVLNKLTKNYEKVSFREKQKQELKNFAIFQFGKEGEKLIADAEVRGNYPNLKIFKEQKQLAMLRENGMLSLTLKGGEVLGKTYFVEIHDFKLKGSIFSQGIKNFDERIRVGDDVVVIQNEKVIGVGIAVMSSFEMKNAKRGEAVKMRHLEKG